MGSFLIKWVSTQDQKLEKIHSLLIYLPIYDHKKYTKEKAN